MPSEASQSGWFVNIGVNCGRNKVECWVRDGIVRSLSLSGLRFGLLML